MSLVAREDGSDREPGTIATPEGDEEFDAGEALTPDAVESSVEGLVTPSGSAPAKYDSDRHEPSLLEKVIDEISHGTLLP